MDGDSVTLDGQSWSIGRRIGVGGAGVVHEALRDDDLLDCAAKFVMGDRNSLRETEFKHLAGASHVMPILATGDYKSTRVIIMPLAERSLCKTINEHPDGMPPNEALPILFDIATGLNELAEAGVIHRDIAAGNILLLDGRWVLADFGIARDVAAETSTYTHKDRFNRRYGAPEQWRRGKITAQTDIYAFGITAYELLHGKPPFHACEDSEDRLMAAHEFESVHVTGEPPWLYALVEQCLAKEPSARPTADALLDTLRQMANPSDVRPVLLPGLQKVLDAHQAGKRRREQINALQLEGERQKQRDDERFKVAERQLIRMSDEFVDTISAQLPLKVASPSRLGSGQWRLELNMATFDFSRCLRAQHTGQPIPYTLLAGAFVSLTIRRHGGGTYTGRTHSLWYADLHAEDELAWYELAFAPGPDRPRVSEQPYGLNASWDDAKVLLGDTSRHQVAWPITVWRPGNLAEPIERWTTWLGEAADGTLTRPQFPERPVAGYCSRGWAADAFALIGHCRRGLWWSTDRRC